MCIFLLGTDVVIVIIVVVDARVEFHLNTINKIICSYNIIENLTENLNLRRKLRRKFKSADTLIE